jgi:N-acetylglucosamine-6-phosphate deacetylase
VRDVLVAGGIIRDVGVGLNATSQIDAAGSYVLPGLIDLHTHGIGFVRNEAGNLAEYAELEAARGTTTFYPTFFNPPARMAEQMERHRRESDELRKCPNVGGFRLEGPYLARTGAGSVESLASITPENTQLMLKAGGGHIRIWDVSPELPGAAELIRQLTGAGIVCSICHTQATIEQARAAVDAGARLVTHMFDTFVLPEMVDPGVYPAGLTDYLLTEDAVTCEIIADGTHVYPILVEEAFRCKTPERIAFVTDSNIGAGLPPGEYTLPSTFGHVVVRGSNDGVRLRDQGMLLAGSALTPIDAFRNAIELFHKDVATASQVCSTTQARLLGLNKGQIAVGKDADLIILDTQFQVLRTIVAGKTIYQK